MRLKIANSNITQYNPLSKHYSFTGKPISDQWAVNRFMMEMLRARYHG